MSSRPTPSKWTNGGSMSRNSAAKPSRSASFPQGGETAKKLFQVTAPGKLDARVRHTRDALGDALIALMQEKPFDSITIQHVLDRANIGRSTFYNHFRDKDDLFLSDVDDFFAFVSTALDRRGDKSNRVAPVQEFFAHIAEAHQFIRALSDSQKLLDVFELGRGHMARGIEARLAVLPATKSLSPVGRAARAHALAGSLFSLATWWLNHQKDATPQQMDHLFHRLVWSGLQPQLRQPFAPKKPGAF
jgi:AcrR family transcriptional regulator